MTDNKDIYRKLQKMEGQLDAIAASLMDSESRTPNQPSRLLSEANPDYRYPSAYGRVDEIDLSELFNILWLGKWWICGLTLLFAVASALYAKSLPNIYRSEALFAPAEEASGSATGKLGGLATLAGVNLGGAETDKIVLAMEIMKSREFIIRFINEHDLLVPLMAVKGWDRDLDQLLIDPEVYDVENKEWVGDLSLVNSMMPSMQEGYHKFMKLFRVSQDKNTSFISLSVEFLSPSIATQWVDWIAKDINEEVKRRDVAEARRSIQYLTEQLEKTSIANLQSIFYELIEEQTKTIMFAEVRDEYVFNTIDKAVVPERKFKPRRAFIVVLGAILGALLGLVIVVVRHLTQSDVKRYARKS